MVNLSSFFDFSTFRRGGGGMGIEKGEGLGVRVTRKSHNQWSILLNFLDFSTYRRGAGSKWSTLLFFSAFRPGGGSKKFI